MASLMSTAATSSPRLAALHAPSLNDKYLLGTTESVNSRLAASTQPKIILDMAFSDNSWEKRTSGSPLLVKDQMYFAAQRDEKNDSRLSNNSQQHSAVPQLTVHEKITVTPRRHFIDNSGRVYFPINLTCGVQVLCRPDVLLRCRAVLKDINADITHCLRILPRSVHSLIRRTRIWVNCSYSFGPEDKPVHLNHSTAHHHEDWLLWAGDRPDKALGIEIYNCFDFRRMRLHWNGCGLLLHEFCHLIHQQALPDGLHNETVKDAFRYARESDLYENVLRRDWAGKNVDYDLAYAMVDHKEYFAEMSVSFWSRGYIDLGDTDCKCIELCSPPLLEPNVCTRVQVVSKQHRTMNNAAYKRLLSLKEYKDDCAENDMNKCKSMFGSCFCPQNNNDDDDDEDAILSHCNKFYPFTSEQLRHHDPTSYCVLHLLWQKIAKWEDPYESVGNTDNTCTSFLSPWKMHAIVRTPLVSAIDTTASVDDTPTEQTDTVDL